MHIEDLYPGLDKKTFQEVMHYASAISGIAKTILEKDTYMTGMLLKLLRNVDDPQKVYFKGGTALSKCHKILKRFSEDCDLFVYTGISDASRTKECNLNKAVTNKLVDLFQENLSLDPHGSPLSKRGGDYNKICIDYDNAFPEDTFKKHVEFEISSSPLRNKKGYYVGSVIKPIQPIIGEILYEKGQKEIADSLSLTPHEINCMTPYKSICDKISRLVRVSYSENSEELVRKYIRDLYDLAVILKDDKYRTYLSSMTFLQEMKQTNLEDSMRQNSFAEQSYGDALVFSNTKQILTNRETIDTYNRTIQRFCFKPEEAPDINQVRDTISGLQPYLERFDNYRIVVKKNSENISRLKQEKENKPFKKEIK